MREQVSWIVVEYFGMLHRQFRCVYVLCVSILVEKRVGLKKGRCRVFETWLGREIWKSYCYSIVA